MKLTWACSSCTLPVAPWAVEEFSRQVIDTRARTSPRLSNIHFILSFYAEQISQRVDALRIYTVCVFRCVGTWLRLPIFVHHFSLSCEEQVSFGWIYSESKLIDNERLPFIPYEKNAQLIHSPVPTWIRLFSTVCTAPSSRSFRFWRQNLWRAGKYGTGICQIRQIVVPWLCPASSSSHAQNPLPSAVPLGRCRSMPPGWESECKCPENTF